LRGMEKGRAPQGARNEREFLEDQVR
jgi:hypothetical protein